MSKTKLHFTATKQDKIVDALNRKHYAYNLATRGRRSAKEDIEKVKTLILASVIAGTGLSVILALSIAKFF